MRRAAASSLAAVTLLVMAAVPAAAAKVKLVPPASESAAPSAKAKGPQPYQASAIATCAGQSCTVSFGKKKKVRRITDVSCLLVSGAGAGLGALIRVDERQISYLPLTSRAANGAGEYASGALAIRFDVPGGEVLGIELASSDVASTANCVVMGTIE